MKKKVLGAALALAFVLGSSMTVCADEPAQEQPGPEVQNYQQMMTPEILASFESMDMDMEDDAVDAVIKNAILLRTDVWGELQDADGDGIDDRDPVNGCGYVDLNYNGFDDRFEITLIGKLSEEDPADAFAGFVMFNIMTHKCQHGVVASSFEFDEEIGYWSVPAYYENCPQCQEEYESAEDVLLAAAMPYIDAIDLLN